MSVGLCMDCKESDFPVQRGECPMPLTDCINGQGERLSVAVACRCGWFMHSTHGPAS